MIIKERLDAMLNREDTLLGRSYTLFMALMVIIVCTTFVVETTDISPPVMRFLIGVDYFITFLFLIDYILRWWVKGFSWRYPFTPMAIIDFISIVPMFVTAQGWQFVRILRIFRILRLLRVLQKDGLVVSYYTEFHLRVFRILFTVFCLIFISSSTIYTVEQDFAPSVFATFFDAFYFSVVTLTTVGYGDIVPISPHGRFFTILIILSGVILIPWQFMTLGRFLVGHYHKHSIVCPKCELSLHEIDANFCKLCGRRLVEREYEEL